MKKTMQDLTIPNTNLAYKKNLIDQKKTTNINILLNRVKLDKKKDLRKKLIFISLLTTVIGLIAILATI